MADSCRPVSRHGRYNASGPSSVQYTSDAPSYGNVDYTPSEEMYTVNQPSRPERPRTSHGRRNKEDIPPRPSSRRSRQVRRPDPPNEESYGRPVSRVGYSPESDYRYSHDEYSRQISLEGEKRIQNSPNNSPEPQDIFSNDPMYPETSLQISPVQRDIPRDSPQSGKIDRLIVSPSSPNPRNYRQSPQGYRESPKGYRQSPQGFRQSPQGLRQSPQGYRQSPQGYRQSPQLARPSSRDNMNVSPIQRDEAQISVNDLHHTEPMNNMDIQDGDHYQQRFQDTSLYGSSSYRDSPHYPESPQYRDSPHYGSSPSEHQTYTRPLPSQRPKSARPKTGRKKSARVRHRHEEIETSQPQHCDASSILNVGDPYGRPSSSLSPYKPLPAIGLATPRNTPGSGSSEPLQSQVQNITMEAQRLTIDNGNQFHPADNDYDTFSVEDIQGAIPNDRTVFSGTGVPNVDMLTNFPQHLSEEIYEKSLLNFERKVSEGEFDDGDHVPSDSGGGVRDKKDNSGIYTSDIENKIRSSEPQPLNVLHELPEEPGASESRILLAIKLPDGKRIQRYFRQNETFETILHFAENTSLTDLSDYWLVCNTPKVTFVDLYQRIGDTPIQDRTVLYLEEKD